MRLFLTFQIILLLTGQTGLALSRVYKLKFENENYYALTIQPKFERPFIPNFAEVMNEKDKNDMGLHHYLAAALKRPPGSRGEATLEAIKFFVFDGDTNYFLNPGQELLMSEHSAMKSVIDNPYLLAHEVEKALVRIGADWYIDQLKKRPDVKKRLAVDPTFAQELEDETEACKNAIGWVLIFDGKKNIIGILAVAARTASSPKLPVEKRHKIWLGDYQNELMILGNPYIDRNGKISVTEWGMSRSITVELKKYIIDRKSPIDLFPVLLFFAEQSGMTFRGPLVDDHIVAFGQDTSEVITPGVSRYILATDDARAEVYSHEPYTFKPLRRAGGDIILQATRDEFIEMWENPRKASRSKVDGKIFLSGAEIVGGIIPLDISRCANMMEGIYTPIDSRPHLK